MENNSTLEKMFNRNAELLQSGFSQKDDEEKFYHSEKFAEKKAFCLWPFLVLFVLWLFTFELSNIN